ncbi:Hypothetical predicted protein [Pelobates cultripes]|uniref:Uncharacterized protein n=1 Tax=Pelobates cultripes TaxID=61616 RepID=A0AAD1SUI3_PELCU|nr:Hypothetical predicted protein [Pelobates cultripes]
MISELGTGPNSLDAHVQQLESTTDTHSTQITCSMQQFSMLNTKLISLRRYMEDLDNRGRRNNIRIRGLLEFNTGIENLPQILTGLFNSFLNCPKDTVIKLDRVHRPHRPKGRPEETPHDIICCLCDFTLKEAIMRQTS